METEKKAPLVLLLAGGRASRLAEKFPNLAKALVSFEEQSFLQILLHRLRREGAGNIILCLGVYSEQILKHIQEINFPGISYSIESKARGTGGAIADAIRLYNISDPFVVANADTWWEASLDSFLSIRLKSTEDAILASVLPVGESRYGFLRTASEGKVIFTRENGEYLYAGAAWFRPELFVNTLPEVELSLEKDILGHGSYSNFILPGRFYDFGTAAGYDELKSFFAKRKPLE